MRSSSGRTVVERTALAGAFRMVTVIDYSDDTQVARTLNVRTNDLQRWLAGEEPSSDARLFAHHRAERRSKRSERGAERVVSAWSFTGCSQRNSAPGSTSPRNMKCYWSENPPGKRFEVEPTWRIVRLSDAEKSIAAKSPAVMLGCRLSSTRCAC